MICEGGGWEDDSEQKLPLESRSTRVGWKCCFELLFILVPKDTKYANLQEMYLK